MTKKNILILYHKNCFDGFGGAWAAWKNFGNKAEYVAVNPETLPDEFPVGKQIYAIDVSYPIVVQEKLRAKNESFVVLDHHAGMSTDTMHFSENIFDNNHSGSVIAWKYFHPQKRIPKFLLHIEDVDLWRWRMNHTREIISVLPLFDYDFRAWDRFSRDIENPERRKTIIQKGKLLALYEKKIIERLTETATTVSLDGVRTLSVNSPILNSEIANELLKRMPPMGIVWAQKGDRVRVSLRSDGTVDVSEIAKKYGGGGHVRASGFVFSAKKKFPWRTLKK